MEKCVCGSGKDSGNCCIKFISGEKIPLTAEEIMRARYYAYTVHDMDYIMKTHDSETVGSISREILTDWSNSSKWISLDIVSTEKGSETDNDGIVEFIAIYEVDGVTYRHHEKSLFVKKEGKWYYNSKLPLNDTITNTDKVGRNDACPCGSGKKYKKCCGK